MATARSPLDIPEIFEMILLAPRELTIRDVLRYRQVSSEWRGRIEDSRNVKQRLHMLPLSKPEGSRKTRFIDTLPRFLKHDGVDVGNNPKTMTVKFIFDSALFGGDNAVMRQQLRRFFVLQGRRRYYIDYFVVGKTVLEDQKTPEFVWAYEIKSALASSRP